MNGGFYAGSPAVTNNLLGAILGSDQELLEQAKYHEDQARQHWLCACRIRLIISRRILVRVGVILLVGYVVINSFGNMIEENFENDKKDDSEKPTTSYHDELEQEPEETITFDEGHSR